MIRSHLLQTRNTTVMLSRNRVLRQHQSLDALYSKAAIGCGNAVFLRKILPRREPRSWLRQSSVSLVCVIKICSGSAKIPVNVEKMVATAPKTPYFTELKEFFQLIPQKNNNINTSKANAGTSRPSTGQPSNQAKQPLCRLRRMSKASFRSRN